MRHFIFLQYSVWKCNIYHLSSLTFRPRWPFFGHLHPSATSSEQDRITQHHISAQIMQPKQKQKFKRWKEIFLTSWKISTNPSIGCVWKKKKQKAAEWTWGTWILLLVTFLFFGRGWVWMAEKGRGWNGFKSCLPAGGGSITFEQPHPFSLWAPSILTGVSSSSSGKLKLSTCQ